MFRNFAKVIGPLAGLALGAALSGCSLVTDNWQEVEGVPLAELDISGDAPTDITLAGPDAVEITEGATLAITLGGDADAGEALRFDRDGTTLTIARDSNIYDGSGTAIVRITMPAPEHLAIAGSGTIKTATMAHTAVVEIAGSGSITVDRLEAETLAVDIAGSGDVTAAGTTAKLEVGIAGSGNVRLGELMADDVAIEIAGAGTVDLASNGKVTADIAGSGDITVTGTATCALQSAGSGSLNCRPAPTAADEGGEAEAGSETTAE